MSNDLTDLDGIGAKTAEKLRDAGINTPAGLADALRRGDSAVTDARRPVREAAREAALGRGESVEDPTLGVTITPENRQAVETLGTARVSDLSSVDTSQAKNTDAVEEGDTTLAELIEPARQGRLGEQDAPQSLIGFAADAASNIKDTDLSSGQIQDVNRLSGTRTAETTLPSRAVRGSAIRAADRLDEKFELDAREVSRAASIHQDRSPKAQRVDERRDAPVTDEISKWEDNPGEYDYVGIDTPEPMSEFFADERKSKRAGFGSFERANRDESTLREGVADIAEASPEVQERVVGEPLEFDPDEVV